MRLVASNETSASRPGDVAISADRKSIDIRTWLEICRIFADLGICFDDDFSLASESSHLFIGEMNQVAVKIEFLLAFGAIFDFGRELQSFQATRISDSFE